MGAAFWIAGATIAATVILIIVFAVCLCFGALRRRLQRQDGASAEKHVPAA